jgi:chromosome segregation ATPase
MTKTPWNWIITAFILAVFGLASLGMYRKEAKNNHSDINTRLRREIQEKNTQLADRDNKLAEKERTITYLQSELEKEKKKNKGIPKTPIDIEETIRSLRHNIESKDRTIHSKDSVINRLNKKVGELQGKIDWYKANCN